MGRLIKAVAPRGIAIRWRPPPVECGRGGTGRTRCSRSSLCTPSRDTSSRTRCARILAVAGDYPFASYRKCMGCHDRWVDLDPAYRALAGHESERLV